MSNTRNLMAALLFAALALPEAVRVPARAMRDDAEASCLYPGG